MILKVTLRNSPGSRTSSPDRYKVCAISIAFRWLLVTIMKSPWTVSIMVTIYCFCFTFLAFLVTVIRSYDQVLHRSSSGANIADVVHVFNDFLANRLVV